MTMVVHVSADYPDAIQPAKTTAIAALVEGTRDRLQHRVYSLNRVMGRDALLQPGKLDILHDDGELASCTYAGAPGALFLTRAMARVARSIAQDLDRLGVRPDFVHGHKLSFEGLAARELARIIECPYVLTLQGNTDQKLLQSRPDIRSAWRATWNDASHVFAFAPWIGKWCDGFLAHRPTPVEPLPCILASDQVIAPVSTPPIVRTAFRLDDWRNKNVEALIKASAKARRTISNLKLEIAGGGSREAELAVDQLIVKAGLNGSAKRVGALPPDQIQQWMNGAAVFALPSRRETFGMVFIEALLAGSPIIYPKGAAVDGYFPDMSFALSVDANDHEAIAVAICKMLDQGNVSKSDLAVWQKTDAARRFSKSAILTQYTKALDRMNR